ncbi:hypothetical protein QN360_19180, partial [Glaciimonas sp. CA11.2]
RLDPFRDFFARFYKGVDGLFKVSANSDANIFLLDSERIAVAAFNSCDRNDCFSMQGAISKDELARCHLDLHDSGKTFALRIAVWHHNIEGPPHRSDYMDVDTVRSMIGKNFRLGLHGHQHKAQAEPQHIYLPDRETMAVVSAGSLCAGEKELPRGVNRQYNIIEIDDDYLAATVHIREMGIVNVFNPALLHSLGGVSYVKIQWGTPKTSVGSMAHPIVEMEQQLIQNAERMLMTGNPLAAIDLLTPMKESINGYARRLYVQAASEAKMWAEIIAVTAIPQSIEELAIRIEACNKSGKFDQAKIALDQFGAQLHAPAALVRDLKSKINAEQAMRS